MGSGDSKGFRGRDAGFFWHRSKPCRIVTIAIFDRAECG